METALYGLPGGARFRPLPDAARCSKAPSDEATSSLSAGETKAAFDIVKSLCARKMGVIYIAHRLEELRSMGDRVTVPRDGARMDNAGR
jgi:ABC-type glutathione transport system ATPase component